MTKKSVTIIEINGLRANTIIGVHQLERDRPQEIIIDLRIEYDGEAASRSDDLADALDYQKLARQVLETVESSSFLLLERLARAALDVMIEDERVTAATIRIAKPAALPRAQGVTLTLSERRE